MPNYLETAVNEHGCVLNLVVYVRNATTFYLTLVEGKFDKNKVKRKNDQDFNLACRIKQASDVGTSIKVYPPTVNTPAVTTVETAFFFLVLFFVHIRYIFNTK